MARPINADAEATRRRILASARLLFSERGIDGASVREIARGADVSLAMVHHYFGSKDDLYAACVAAMDAELDELQRSLAAELAQGGAVPQLLERAMRLGFRYGRAHQIETRLLMRHVATEGELPEGRREGRQAPFLAESSTLIGAALGRDPA
jgi:AcrR family transcriptional regulator